jgi:putative holliday junction resolvase
VGVSDKIPAKEEVIRVVVGLPLQSSGLPSESTRYVNQFLARFVKLFPAIPVVMFDERYTSVMAQAAILQSGARKTQRQDKSLVDMVSATILLQSYMEAPHRALPAGIEKSTKTS